MLKTDEGRTQGGFREWAEELVGIAKAGRLEAPLLRRFGETVQPRLNAPLTRRR